MYQWAATHRYRVALRGRPPSSAPAEALHAQDETKNARRGGGRTDIQPAHQDYLARAEALVGQPNLRDTRGQLALRPAIPLGLAELDGYLAHAERQIDQVRRRVRNGDTIPHTGKVFSLFEPHTARNITEMKVLIAVLADAIGATRLPRLFHDAGCRVTVYCPAHFAIRYSRYAHRHIPAPEDPEEFVATLGRHFAAEGECYQWAGAGEETSLRAIMAYKGHENWASRIMPVSDNPDSLALITSKVELLSHAESFGIRIPAQQRFDSIAAVEAAASRLSYPLVVKLPESMAASGVRFVGSREELCQQKWEDEAAQVPVIIQDFVTGENGSTEVLFEHGRPVCWLSSFHREFWPNFLAASCVRELVDLPEIEELLQKVGSMTGFHGLAGIDWIRNPVNQMLYFIELNPRPTPCYHLGSRVGVDFSRALREWVKGDPVNVQRPRAPKPRQALVYQFPQYCYRAIDDRAFHLLVRVLPDVPRNDPNLVAALLRRVMTHNLPKSMRGFLRKVLRPPKS